MRKLIFLSFFLPFISILGQTTVIKNKGKLETTDVKVIEEIKIILDSVDVLGSTLPSEKGHLVYSKSEIDILNSPYQNVGEILETFPGLEIRSRSLNDVQADISLRGSTFDQVLILVNGVPYSDPQTGHHNMNLPVPSGAIKSIHAMPSGGSYRYGPFAFAGVIDIVTKNGSDPGGYASAGIGQYGYQNGSAGLSLGKILGFFTRIDLDYKAAAGELGNRDFAQWQAFLSTERQIKDIGKLSFNGGYLAKKFGAFNFYSFNFPDQFEAIQSLSANVKIESKYGTIKGYVRQHSDHFELFREEAGFYEYTGDGQFFNTNDSSLAPSWYNEHNNHRSHTYGLDYESKDISIQIGKVSSSLKYGIDFRRDNIISNVLGKDLATPIMADQRAFYLKGDLRNNGGIFTQYNLGNLNTGVRINYNDNYGMDWLPNIDYVHSFNNSTAIKGSVNRSFRLPTFTDLYYTLGGAQGSINLKPEYAWNSELSFSQSFDKNQSILPSKISITAYHRYGENLIDWIYRTVGSEQLLQADNLTQVSIYGAELKAMGNLNNKLFYSINGQFASHQTGSIDGQSIYVLDYLANRFQAELNSIVLNGFQFGLVGTRQERAGSFISSSGEETKYPAFTTLDLRLSYDHDGLFIYLDALNLFDEEIYDRGNVPLAGRWVKLGLRFHW